LKVVKNKELREKTKKKQKKNILIVFPFGFEFQLKNVATNVSIALHVKG
jgi:hypothetical protein